MKYVFHHGLVEIWLHPKLDYVQMSIRVGAILDDKFVCGCDKFQMGGEKCQFSSILTEKCQDHFHLYKYTKRQE